MTALAQYPAGRSKVQVAVLTGCAVSGGGFNNYLGALRSRELILGDGEHLKITEAGMSELGTWEPLPAGSGLVDYWRARLEKAERLILEALTEAYPNALTKEEVAARAGYEPHGGGFNNALGRLRTLELVQGGASCRRAIICSAAERPENTPIEYTCIFDVWQIPNPFIQHNLFYGHTNHRPSRAPRQ